MALSCFSVRLAMVLAMRLPRAGPGFGARIVRSDAEAVSHDVGLRSRNSAPARHTAAMQIPQPVQEGRFLRRYKRFLADVELPGGEVITAHCPNTGAMLGCLEEGARAILRDSQNPERKLRHTLQTLEVDGTWVNVDTSLPNGLVAGGVEAGQIEELAAYESLRREVKAGKSRIDLLLEGEAGRCWVEVKSTTLVQDGIARFPDAVTVRGQKHLEELAQLVQGGDRAVIFFSVARDDADCFAPADAIDPDYGALLRKVVGLGVEALAYTTRVEPDSLEIARSLPITLGTG